jgi:hypothetical protein
MAFERYAQIAIQVVGLGFARMILIILLLPLILDINDMLLTCACSRFNITHKGASDVNAVEKLDCHF